MQRIAPHVAGLRKATPALCVLLVAVIWGSGVVAQPTLGSCSAGVCQGRNRECNPNGDGTFSCPCKEGFQPRRQGAINCVDINECTAAASPCKAGEECGNTRGGFTCTATACAAANDPCVGAGKACSVSATGAAVCGACLGELVPTPDGEECVDDPCSPTDPCALLGKACATGNDGKAACGACLSGLLLTPDKSKCVADACKPTDPCAPLGKACSTGNDGKAACGACLSGLVLAPDGKACVTPDACRPDPCASLNRACALGADGKADCSRCKAGYAVPPGGDPAKGKCEDIDECANSDSCPDRACTNAPGGFTCGKCKSGFKDTPDGPCVDTDECAPADNECAKANRRCLNFLEGKGYQCMECLEGWIETGGVCVKQPDCGPGFSADALNCANIDECATGVHDCEATAYCVDTDGGFFCACAAGLQPKSNRKGCEDFDECANGYCDTVRDGGIRATCTNYLGGYACTCNTGFVGNGRICDDFDECANGYCDNVVDGGIRATCINKLGGYDCTCNAGFEGDGSTCDDIDECSNIPYPCDSTTNPNGGGMLGVCDNYVGTYVCSCVAGFSGDGVTCTDIDECKTLCPASANLVCTNTPGRYTCVCPTVAPPIASWTLVTNGGVAIGCSANCGGTDTPVDFNGDGYYDDCSNQSCM